MIVFLEDLDDLIVGINEEALMTMGINLTEAGTTVAVNQTGERGTLRINVLDKNIEGDLLQEILETTNATKKTVVDEVILPTGTVKGTITMRPIETIEKQAETEINKLAKEE